jgi:hypothetical protein
MSDLSSDSSDSEQDPVNTVENENHSLSLNAVNDCIREYEKGQKKELRKKRFDAKGTLQQAEVSLEALQTITLTKKQVKELANLNKKEQTDKQKEAQKLAVIARAAAREKARITADLRKDKGTPGIIMKVAQKMKPRADTKPKKIEVSAEESEEEEEAPPPKAFQARKPKLEEEIEEKVQKLTKLDAIINSNPYYAMIMAQRQGKRQ